MFNANTTDLVQAALEQRPDTRDDDKKLLGIIWTKLLGTDEVRTNSALWLIQKYVRGELPNAESIRRTRQKLQEEHEHLRGEKYKERQEKMEPAVREEVRDFHGQG